MLVWSKCLSALYFLLSFLLIFSHLFFTLFFLRKNQLYIVIVLKRGGQWKQNLLHHKQHIWPLLTLHNDVHNRFFHLWKNRSSPPTVHRMCYKQNNLDANIFPCQLFQQILLLLPFSSFQNIFHISK